MGRYIERAENIARILDINETFARNVDGVSDWMRVLELYADANRFNEVMEGSNEGSVPAFYLLEMSNPTSVIAALRSARENGRSIRHLISTEMWTQLNIMYKDMQARTRRDVQPQNLSRFCKAIILDCQSFEGIAEGTFFRGESWVFYQIGKHLERADQTTRILDMSYDRLDRNPGDAVGSVFWDSLLRSVSGYHAYRLSHPGHSDPNDITRFLLYDREFPRAVALCVEQITTRIGELERRHGVKRRNRVEKARCELTYTLETGLDSQLTPKRLHVFLDDLQSGIGNLSSALASTYFD